MHHRMIKDFGLTAPMLAAKYDEAEQHPVVRLADWRRAVRDYRTELGYWDFVHFRIAEYRAELDKCNPYNQLMGV